MADDSDHSDDEEQSQYGGTEDAEPTTTIEEGEGDGEDEGDEGERDESADE